jgi:two-component system cell cycle response regulator
MSSEEQDTAVSDVGKPLPRAALDDCLVVIYPLGPGGNVAERFELKRPKIRIGRAPDNEIVLEDVNVSRRHARLERRGERLFLIDEGSTNRTLLNDTDVVHEVVLENGDRIKTGSTIFKYLRGTDIEAAYHEQAYKNVVTDNLTGLWSRYRFDIELEREYSRCRRHGHPLSLLFIDVDHFKTVNDTYGHPAGDEVLRGVGEAIRDTVGDEDVCARYGGEEMVALLPESPLETAAGLAELIRSRIASHRFVAYGVNIRVTISIGCATSDPTDMSSADLLNRGDQKLYLAKNKGRNRVEW